MRLARTALVVAVLAGACTTAADPATTLAPVVETSPQVESGPLPVVIDYSPTVSDVGALLYLLSHPNVDVLAITMPVTGEAGCELGAEVTLGVLAMVDRNDIPVACDPDVPDGAMTWPAEFLTGHESLAFGLPEPVAEIDPRPSHEVIAEAVAGSDRPVTLYAVAPLTNVERTLAQHEGVVDGIDRIVVMGGAVDAPGNVSGSDAEWNLWIDPGATAAVFGSGAPITLVPLDATNDVPTPDLWRNELEAAEQSDAVAYLTTLVRLFPAVTSGFYYLWDELAAAVAAGEDLVTTETATLVVTADGATVRDPDGSAVIVATGVPNPDRFYGNFLGTISGGTVAAPDPVSIDGDSIPDIDAGSSPTEVLAAWMVLAARGDSSAAAMVEPDAPWDGIGETPAVYIDGSAPFGAYDLALECIGIDAVASCEMTFRDRWIDAIPELDGGVVRAEAVVEGGSIVAFRTFSFDPSNIAAFDGHGAWLEETRSAELAAACGDDPAARPCSELFVSTVEEWVSSR